MRLASCTAAYAVAVRTADSTFFAIDTWFKWDSGHYFDIAHKGYELMDCAGIPPQHPGQWCGNSAWFPGYPYVVRGVHLLTSVDTKLVALIVSQIFAVVSLTLIWNLFLSRRNVPLLLLCAFAPGTYYFLFIFPMSMAMCFMLVTLWAQRQQDYLLAFLAGTVAGFTYPSGMWLAGGLASGLLFDLWRGRRPPRERGFRWPVRSLASALSCSSTIWSLGVWNAFFLTRGEVSARHQQPRSFAVPSDWRTSGGRSTGWPAALQSLIAAVLVLVGTASAARAVWRRKEQPGDVAVAVHGLTYWVLAARDRRRPERRSDPSRCSCRP